MKQYKALSPDTAAMFFSVDNDNNKILCMSCVPKVNIGPCVRVLFVVLQNACFPGDE